MLDFKTAHILDVGQTQEQEELFHEIENILWEQNILCTAPYIYDCDTYLPKREAETMCLLKLQEPDICILLDPNNLSDNTKMRIQQANRLEKPIFVWSHGSLLPFHNRFDWDKTKIRLAATITIHNTKESFFTNTQFTNWQDEHHNLYTKPYLNRLAVGINSPWSQAHDQYLIKANAKDAYTEIPEKEPLFICTYHVIGAENIQTELYGYGNTEEEALQNCQALFAHLQQTYNPEDESF